MVDGLILKKLYIDLSKFMLEDTNEIITFQLVKLPYCYLMTKIIPSIICGKSSHINVNAHPSTLLLIDLPAIFGVKNLIKQLLGTTVTLYGAI